MTKTVLDGANSQNAAFLLSTRPKGSSPKKLSSSSPLRRSASRVGRIDDKGMAFSSPSASSSSSISTYNLNLNTLSSNDENDIAIIRSPSQRQNNDNEPQHQDTKATTSINTTTHKPNLFQRDSPRSKRNLRSLLINLIEESSSSSYPSSPTSSKNSRNNNNNYRLSSHINLHQHSIDSSSPITDTFLQELCLLHGRHISSLNLSHSQCTDATLLLLSRYCPSLSTLTWHSIGPHVSRVGFRSLMANCRHLKRLDVSHAGDTIDDDVLKVIAAGVGSSSSSSSYPSSSSDDQYLSEMILSHCQNIGDEGITALARCGTDRWTVLEMRYCPRIGEFGDRALLAVGKYCVRLRVLDLRGCRHVSDGGLVAVGKGCRLLEEGYFSGCEGVTGGAVRSFAERYGNSSSCCLRVLSLENCRRMGDGDLKSLGGIVTLESLDLSGCVGIGGRGLAVISRNLNQLRKLILAKCSSVNDSAMEALTQAEGCLRRTLYEIDLSHCESLTQRGLEALVTTCSALSYVNVTGCHRIDRSILYQLAHHLPFCDVATTHMGYQPKPNVPELRKQKALYELQTKAAINIQRFFRGCLARYIHVRHAKKSHVIKHKLPLIQATIRKNRQRHKYLTLLSHRRRIRSATLIASTYRGTISRRLISHLINARETLRKREQIAILLQRTYRGYRGQCATTHRRNEIARYHLRMAQIAARDECAATLMQRYVRRLMAIKRLTTRRREHQQQLDREAQRHREALRLQRTIRGAWGRRTAHNRRCDMERIEQDHFNARWIQTLWRGRKGRQHAAQRKVLREKKRSVDAALLVQRRWRGSCGRHAATIMASLKRLRREEAKAAVTMQRIYRGRMDRARVCRMAMERDFIRRRLAAVQCLQRVFRGHKGREDAAVRKALLDMEYKARPLYHARKVEERNLHENQRLQEEVTATLNRSETTIRHWETEICLMAQTQARYWDSDQITGAPQRYKKELLQERLQEKIQQAQRDTQRVRDYLTDLQTTEREISRRLRNIERELVPLTTGVMERTIMERSQRLRDTVRRERASSVMIQAVWRGCRLRMAMMSPLRDYWIRHYDNVTGQHVYFNTWSHEKRGMEPLEFRLVEEFGWRRDEEGWEEEKT